MTDIKIKRTNTTGEYTEETAIEVTGLEYGADDLTKQLVETMCHAGITAKEMGAQLADGQRKVLGVEREDAQQSEAVPGLCKLRMVVNGDISPEDFKTAVEEGNVDELIGPFDEIEIPLDTGGSVTVVCGYSDSHTARFVMKDCWDEAVMNEENTNKGGYYKSKGRKHVLEDIWPHISPEWQAIIKPRTITENIDGECVVYKDPMWLPSATDVFGPSEDGYWKDIDDSFQLPIFEKERDRVKECGDEGTYPYWLRSVNATNTYYFRYVNTGGSSRNDYAYNSYGFAPGFDI